jgi:hypothetical protein
MVEAGTISLALLYNTLGGGVEDSVTPLSHAYGLMERNAPYFGLLSAKKILE